MTNSVKDRISTDLQRAKSEGSLRSERIRQIVKSAITQAIAELKEGSVEIRTVAQDAFSAVLENVQDQGQKTKEDLQASVEGIIEGVSESRRDAIAQTQTQIQELQTQIDHQEQQLESDVDGALVQIESTGQQSSSAVKDALNEILNRFRDREEFSAMKEQYARLKGQLAILDANLAARYGERYDDVKRHMETAKTWYTNAKTEAEREGVDKVHKTQVEVEAKMGEIGGAIARKEARVKELLKELWVTVTKG
jgi:hypothetical protein